MDLEVRVFFGYSTVRMSLTRPNVIGKNGLSSLAYPLFLYL